MRLNRPRKKYVSTDGYGRVYVHRFELEDGTVLHKVGMCESDRTLDRLMEITRSFFSSYRYIPYIRMRKDKKTLIPRLMEKHLHEVLSEYKYKFDKKFDGSSEFFRDIDETVLLDYISELDDLDFLKTNSMEVKYYDILTEESRRRKETNQQEGTQELPF